MARAKLIGDDLSGYSLFTDRIQLADGATYTVTAAQAQTAQIGSSGAQALVTKIGASSFWPGLHSGLEFRKLMLYNK